jgi:plastocyanin
MQVDRRVFTQMVLSAAGAAAAGGPALAAQSKTVEVSMVNAPGAKFEPETVTIAAGDTVQWTNPQAVGHTVTFDPKEAVNKSLVVLPAGVAPFDSGDMGEGAVFKHTFAEKGTYKYICLYHEAMGMVGTVIVT